MVVKRGDWKNTPRDCYLLPGSEYRVFSTMIRSGVRTAKGRNRSESESTFFGSLLGPYDTTLELAKCQWVNRYRVQRTKLPTSADITSKPLGAGRILTPLKMNNRWGSERQQRRDWSFRLAIGASTGFLLIILWVFDSWPNGDSHIPSDISTLVSLRWFYSHQLHFRLLFLTTSLNAKTGLLSFFPGWTSTFFAPNIERPIEQTGRARFWKPQHE